MLKPQRQNVTPTLQFNSTVRKFPINLAARVKIVNLAHFSKCNLKVNMSRNACSETHANVNKRHEVSPEIRARETQTGKVIAQSTVALS